MLDDDMMTLNKFMPAKGRLLLACIGDAAVGIACLKQLTAGIGEIKRMYVRPEYRGRWVGRALIQHLLHEAGAIGYQCIRLDSAGFMKEAHRLYRSIGFREIEAYAGSEIPKEFQRHWIFMELDLPVTRDDSMLKSPNH